MIIQNIVLDSLIIFNTTVRAIHIPNDEARNNIQSRTKHTSAYLFNISILAKLKDYAAPRDLIA